MADNQTKKPVELTVEQKDRVNEELAQMERVINSIDYNDGQFFYGDLANSIQVLNELLTPLTWYDNLKEERKAAFTQIQSNSEKEIRAGIQKIRIWLQKIKALLK